MKVCVVSIINEDFPEIFSELNIFEIKKGSLNEKVKFAFNFFDSIIFIGSIGVVIRVVSKFLKNKFTDPSILVFDEKYKNLILLIGAHMAGGYRVGEIISKRFNSNFVFTTSTDVNNLVGVDLFCRDNNLFMKKENVLLINKIILNQGFITVSKDFKSFDLPNNFIISDKPFLFLDNYKEGVYSLFSKNYVLGLGFHKDIPFEILNKEYEESVPIFIREKIQIASSIEKKWNTYVFHKFIRENNIYISKFYKADELNEASKELKLKENPYVMKATGASAVSEPSAFIASFKGEKIFENKNNNSKFVIFKIDSSKKEKNNYIFEKVPEVFYG